MIGPANRALWSSGELGTEPSLSRRTWRRALRIAARHSRMVRAAAHRGSGGGGSGDGRRRRGFDLQSVSDAAAEIAGRHGQSRGFRHQDHDGIAASVRLLHRSAALRGLGQDRDAGSRPTPITSNSSTLRAKVVMEDKSTVTMDARTGYSTASSNCSTCGRISSCNPPPAMKRDCRRPMSISARAR